MPVEQPMWIPLPFKDQKSADVLRKQLNSLSNRIGTPLQPICTSRKLGDALSVKEQKRSLINQHSMAYKFSCSLCHAEYIGLATRHLFQRIEEHCRSSSSICRHLQQDHDTTPRSLDLAKNFAVLRKCQGKMDCLVYEMLLIKKYRPSLNIQSDSITCLSIHLTLCFFVSGHCMIHWFRKIDYCFRLTFLSSYLCKFSSFS